MLNVAVLGSGWAGNVHLNIYHKNKDTNIVGIFGIPIDQTKKIAEKFNCKAYDNFNKLFSENKIDIVSICLPTYLHAEYLEKCMNQNVNIFCEKPLTIDYKEAEKIQKMFHNYDKKIMFGYVHRFMGGHEKVKEYLLTKKYGNIKSFYIYMLGPMPTWGSWFPNEKLSGGGILDVGIHELDYVYWLLGFPEKVYSVGSRISGTNNWAQAFTVFKYQGDLHAVLEVNQNMPKPFPYHSGYRATFEDAVLVFSFAAPEKAEEGIDPDFAEGGNLRVYENSEKFGKDISIDKTDGYEKEIYYFIDKVMNNKPIDTSTLEDAVNGVKLYNLVKDSLESK